MITQSTNLSWDTNTQCIAFIGSRRIAAGDLARVAVRAKAALDRDPRGEPLVILNSRTSELIEVDFRGSTGDVLRRLPTPDKDLHDSTGAPTEPARGPGRPKLGVVAREVTLLPRHWNWLNEQPGGASVALRKLVEEARKANEGKDRKRKAQESVFRFISTMAGNRPGFEDAARALYANDQKRFGAVVALWPKGVGTHAMKLAGESFAAAQ